MTESRNLKMAGLVFLLVIGGWLRIACLDRYPLGVQQDELSDVYDGYSILTTGADRFGDRYPVIVRGFGENDYRPALYPWLTVLPQAVSGFSVAAGRLPSALMGVASLLLMFAFARRMAGTTYAFAVLLFAALSPMHIQYSRLAHEGAILPAFFVIVALYLWQKASLDGYREWVLAALGFATGFSSNAYQATKLTAFVFAALMIVDIARHATPRVRKIIVFSLAAFAGALPQIIVLFRETDRFFARAKILSVTADGPFGYVAEVVRNYWLNLEPRYLFLPGEILDLTVARLLPVEVLFFYTGIAGLFLLKGVEKRSRYFLFLALVISILPAAITTGNPNTLRASGFAVLSPFLSGAGMVLLASLINSDRVRRRLYYPIAVGAVLISAGALLNWYMKSPVYREAYFQQILVDMSKKLGAYEDEYDRIILERFGTQPYIYIASYSPMTPREFQQAPKSFYSTGMDEFTMLGKYHFVPSPDLHAAIDEARTAGLRYLVVSPGLLSGMEPVDSVSYWPERLYFLAQPTDHSR
ncbi:MAG: glycosyltransferase family 39 protein [Gemmatimonadaceae bacterium]